MHEWDRLKARYWSKGYYARRQVISDFYIDKDDFIQYLTDQGAEIMLNPKQSESFRFRLKGELGVVYEKGSGNLLAHDMGISYDDSKNKTSISESVTA